MSRRRRSTGYCAAFLQIYREEAHYLERTAPWVERIGLSSSSGWWKTPRVASTGRGALPLLTARFAQIDPWAQRAQGVDKHEFIPLKLVS